MADHHQHPHYSSQGYVGGGDVNAMTSGTSGSNSGGNAYSHHPSQQPPPQQYHQAVPPYHQQAPPPPTHHLHPNSAGYGPPPGGGSLQGGGYHSSQSMTGISTSAASQSGPLPSSSMLSPSDIGGGNEPRKEIYTYQAPWTVFSMAWAHRIDQASQFRLAIGSYVEQYSNSIQIVYKGREDEGIVDDETAAIAAGSSASLDSQMYEACKIDHPYPCTKILWTPDRSHGTKDLLATTGDYLRIWSLSHEVDLSSDNNNGTAIGSSGSNNNLCNTKLRHKKEALLDNNKNSEYCAPLTSFDWNETDPHILGTSSIDTTCTIWDINTQTAKTQLIAHDKEVFDIAFARGPHVFASVGADGSVRMFDLRSLEHSTIIYESPKFSPLLRLAWNKQDPNYLATFAVDAASTTILDLRVPSVPVAQLGGHTACVNAVSWAPHTSCHICSTGEDRQALIWDLSALSTKPVEDPTLQFTADGEINNLQWSAVQPQWISIAYNDRLQILRV